MRVLLLIQSVSIEYIETLQMALPDGTDMILITGSNIPEQEGLRIIKTAPHSPISLRSRLVCWIQYYHDVMRWSKSFHYNVDMIYAVSNPPINSYIGNKLKKKFKAPFVYMNWDIYPQIIAKTFEKNLIVQIFCSIWGKINNILYHNVDQMLTIGDVMRDSINYELKRPIMIKVVSIGTNCNRLRPIDKKNNIFLKQHNLQNKFIVLYSGKMGKGHNMEMILKAAEQLKEEQEIIFILIGSGEKFKEVQEYVLSSNLTNTLVLPLQNEEIFPYSMASGDIGIVSQEMSLSHLFMPSKVFDMMATGTAIIGLCSKNDDLSNLISKEKIGIIIDRQNAIDLKDAILSLYTEHHLCEEYKINARNSAEAKYSKEMVVQKYQQIFREFIGESK